MYLPIVFSRILDSVFDDDIDLAFTGFRDGEDNSKNSLNIGMVLFQIPEAEFQT